MKYTHEEITARVKLCVSQVLMGMDVTEIEYNASLIEDLGLDSLDFVDLLFRLETAFGVRIKRGQIEGTARASAQDESFEKDGVLTPEGIASLQHAMPEVPKERFKAGMKTTDIPSLFTVGTFVKLVEFTLAENGQS